MAEPKEGLNIWKGWNVRLRGTPSTKQQQLRRWAFFCEAEWESVVDILNSIQACRRRRVGMPVFRLDECSKHYKLFGLRRREFLKELSHLPARRCSQLESRNSGILWFRDFCCGKPADPIQMELGLSAGMLSTRVAGFATIPVVYHWNLDKLDAGCLMRRRRESATTMSTTMMIRSEYKMQTDRYYVLYWMSVVGQSTAFLFFLTPPSLRNQNNQW
jgi:hypothetical protein